MRSRLVDELGAHDHAVRPRGVGEGVAQLVLQLAGSEHDEPGSGAPGGNRSPGRGQLPHALHLREPADEERHRRRGRDVVVGAHLGSAGRPRVIETRIHPVPDGVDPVVRPAVGGEVLAHGLADGDDRRRLMPQSVLPGLDDGRRRHRLAAALGAVHVEDHRRIDQRREHEAGRGRQPVVDRDDVEGLVAVALAHAVGPDHVRRRQLAEEGSPGLGFAVEEGGIERRELERPRPVCAIRRVGVGGSQRGEDFHLMPGGAQGRDHGAGVGAQAADDVGRVFPGDDGDAHQGWALSECRITLTLALSLPGRGDRTGPSGLDGGWIPASAGMTKWGLGMITGGWHAAGRRTAPHPSPLPGERGPDRAAARRRTA